MNRILSIVILTVIVSNCYGQKEEDFLYRTAFERILPYSLNKFNGCIGKNYNDTQDSMYIIQDSALKFSRNGNYIYRLVNTTMTDVNEKTYKGIYLSYLYQSPDSLKIASAYDIIAEEFTRYTIRKIANGTDMYLQPFMAPPSNKTGLELKAWRTGYYLFPLKYKEEREKRVKEKNGEGNVERNFFTEKIKEIGGYRKILIALSVSVIGTNANHEKIYAVTLLINSNDGPYTFD